MNDPTWETKLASLTNAVATAVHAANPSIQVIGLGAQGTQIFNMLAMGTLMDGVVYHPYANGNNIPDTTYEWEYLDYGSWIQVLDSKPVLPKWETEWGIGTDSDFHQHRAGRGSSRAECCKNLASAWNIRSSTNSWTTVRASRRREQHAGAETSILCCSTHYIRSGRNSGRKWQVCERDFGCQRGSG